MRFDTAFAINVGLFRVDARRELDVLRQALKPTGALYLFQQHPSAGRTRAITQKLRAALTTNEFVVREVRSTGSGDSTMTCIVAARPIHVHQVDFFHGRARKVMDSLSSAPRISNT